MERAAKGRAALHRTLGAVLVAIGLAAVAPAAAEATTTCEYNGEAEVLNVKMAASGDSTILKLIGTSIDVRQASGLVSCSGGTPTTANTDAVNVFDESGSGATTLSVGTPQGFAAALAINYSSGGGEDAVQIFSENVVASIIAGSSGLNTDGAAGKDINFLTTPERIELAGSPNPDTLSARGGAGTGTVLSGPFVQLHGGAGNDSLEGSDGGDLIEGEGGSDTMRAHAGDDVLIGDVLAESGNDSYDGGAGFDYVSYPLVTGGVSVDLAVSGPQQTGNGEDAFSEIDGVLGTSFDDTILGSAGANVIKAGDGNDAVSGRGGEDLLSGAAGTDTLSYAEAPAGVIVDLGAGTATGGEGKDSLGPGDFENLIGSPFADTLTGSAAANRISGLAGADLVAALGGPDRVEIRDGGPDSASCGSEIDTAISDQLSVDSVQADCELVDALPGAGAGAGQGSPDRRLLFTLRGARRQALLNQGAVLVKLRCPQESCRVLVSAAGRVPLIGSAGASRKLRLGPVRTKLAAGATKTVKLRLGKRQLGLLAAALQIGKRPKLRITATATDTAGNTALGRLSVRARP